MLDWIPDGIAYGLIDNGVLAFSTLLGIDIDKYFKGSGIHGATVSYTHMTLPTIYSV